MEVFTLFAILISLSAAFAYLNIRFIRLPPTIGLMVGGLLLSLLSQGLGRLLPSFEAWVKALLQSLDFSSFLLDTILCFLLFAGSLHVRLGTLLALRRRIIAYATLGVLLSTLLIAFLIRLLFPLVGIEVDWITCLLFGALISPTDPIAILSILSKSELSEKIKTEIVGESLFNDGTGVVAFLTVLGIVQMGMQAIKPAEVALLVGQEIGGGLLLGWGLGYGAYWLHKSIDHYQTEVLITLSIVMGGYTLARELHVSGPLAMVVAGLMTGSQGRNQVISEATREYLTKFWEVIDEVLNALLFVLIGLQFVLIPFTWYYLLGGGLAVGVVLGARWLSVGLPLYLFFPRAPDNRKVLLLLTWGGLRGGISVALALSSYARIPQGNLLLSITYMVVLFSILAQGLTFEGLVKRLKE